MTFNFNQIRQKCISEAKQNIKDSVTDDVLIIQAISAIEELDKIINQISTRVKEWYSYYNPELSNAINNNEKLVEKLLNKSKEELLKELLIDCSMGADLSIEDVNVILDLARRAKSLIDCRENEKRYLEEKMKKICPNFLEILGVTIGAKILRHSGSLEKLSRTPSTVLQIMGAEKSLFKHMIGRGKSPKYGIIFSHQMIAGVNRKNKGKMARAIADKASIAARIDFFKGDYVADKFVHGLEKKFNSLK
jgi:nucleolar protein 56